MKSALGLITLILALPASPAAEPLHSGYAIIADAPVAVDLEQAVYVPRVHGQTVLDGLLHILRGTGYRLADAMASDPEVGRLYRQPYPENQRHIGPRELGVVLEQLAGPAWQLVEDPVNRLLSFEVRPTYRAAAAPEMPVVEVVP